MKEEWVTSGEFIALFGMTKAALYTKISRDSRVGAPDFDSKYKLQGRTRLINKAWFDAEKEERNRVESRFHSAYYRGVDVFKSEYAFARHVAEEMGISPWTVSGYFRCNFTQQCRRPVGRRLQYIEAMERIVNEKISSSSTPPHSNGV